MRAFVASADPAFRLGVDGAIKWREATIARLVKGDSLYAPRAELVSSDLLSIDQTQRMNKRLLTFITTNIETTLGRLVALEMPDAASMKSAKPQPKTSPPAVKMPDDDKVRESTLADAETLGTSVSDRNRVSEGVKTETQYAAPNGLSGAAKGIAYILFERLGSVPTVEIVHLIRTLKEHDKPLLARLGLRFGVETVYMPELLKPAQIELRSLLFTLANGQFYVGTPPPAGRVAIDQVADVPDAYWLAVGYRRLGQRVMRVDMVERVAMLVRTAAREGHFKITEEMLSLAGATREQMGQMLLDLNCVVVGEESSEDPEKPPLQIFQRKRKTHSLQNDRGGSGNKHKGSTTKQGRKGQNHNGQNQNQKSANRSRPNHKRSKEKQPDPNSPFAVLAALKTKV